MKRAASLVIAAACAPSAAPPPPITPHPTAAASPPPADAPPAPVIDVVLDQYRYLDALAQTVTARIISTSGTEISIAAGSDRGVANDWTANILQGDTDRPLAGGDVTISRIHKRVTIGSVRIPPDQLQHNPRVRLSPPAQAQPPAPAAPTHAPHDIARIELHYSFGSLHCSNDHRYAVAWNGREYRSVSGTIDPALIDALHASLADVQPSDREQTCTSHTDDYPSFTIALGADPAAPSIVITSQSNCRPDNSPWNIVRGAERFQQADGQLGAAVHALLAALDPARWKSGDWYRECERR